MSWEKIRLGNICTKIGSGATPKGGSTVYVSNGTALIRSQNIYNLQFSYTGLAYINDEAAKKLDGVNICLEDVLINITGDSVARTCIVPKSVLPARVNQHVCIIRSNKDTLNPRFLNYYLASPYMQSYMLGLAVGKGASRNAMTKDMISDFKIPCPPIETQHRIADILSAYDDLIENNQKQIKLLEEAAQRLYKEWFVDLHFPGWEHTKITDGIPDGWESAVIADICQTIGGGTPSTKVPAYYEGGTIPWVTPTDITHSNSVALLDTEKKITEEGLKNSSAKMLPAETVLMTSRASVGYFGIYPYEVCTNQGFISCIPNSINLQMYLLYNLMERVEEIRQKAGGSTYLEISKKAFRDMNIIVPSDNVLNRFQQYAYDIFLAIREKEKANLLLQEARDRLLPKLMSGELEV